MSKLVQRIVALVVMLAVVMSAAHPPLWWIIRS